MGQALAKTNGTSQTRTEEKLLSKPVDLTQTSSSCNSTLIHAVDTGENVLQPVDQSTWGTSKMLCCFTSTGTQLNSSLGTPKLSSLLWQGSGGLNSLLTRTLGGDLLPAVQPEHEGRITLVLDLDETLLHSNFTPVSGAHFIVSVPVEGEPTDVYVVKRPWLDYFLEQVALHFEVVVFTASLAVYADVVLDKVEELTEAHWEGQSGNYPCISPTLSSSKESALTIAAASPPGRHRSGVSVATQDTDSITDASGDVCHNVVHGCQSLGHLTWNDNGSTTARPSTCTSKSHHSARRIHHRLYRGSCVKSGGTYIKDLTRLGRPLERTIIVDNSPVSYSWQPTNALPSVTFMDDASDNGLMKILDVLMLLKDAPDVRQALPSAQVTAGYSARK